MGVRNLFWQRNSSLAENINYVDMLEEDLWQFVSKMQGARYHVALCGTYE